MFRTSEKVSAVDAAHTDTLCPAEHVAVRLAGGIGWHKGRVELYMHGKWGSVCDEGFGERNAKVICSLLDLPKYV